MSNLLKGWVDSRDIWPKRVKLDFRGADGTKDVLSWSPGEERLHEVFLRYQQSIYDFSLKYKDKDGDELVLDPSKRGIEEMLENVDGGTVRITVAWRMPLSGERVMMSARRRSEQMSAAAREAIEKAKIWITGGGKASEKDVSTAEKEVEKSGGRIVPSKAKGALVRYQGCDLEHWHTVCENLQNELELSSDEVATLKNAQFCDECEAFVFSDLPVGPVHSTRVVAYRTVRDVPNNKIHIVYGRHESSMQASSQALDFPLNNCIKLGDRTFTVLPPASPHFNHDGQDMKNNPFEIPPGWTPVAESDEHFASIVRDVVAPYYWGAGILIVQGGAGRPAWVYWHTARCGSDAGKDGGAATAFTPLTGSRFMFKDAWSCRLLVEAVPAKSPELINSWKRYVQISAQADWGSRLNLGQPEKGGAL